MNQKGIVISGLIYALLVFFLLLLLTLLSVLWYRQNALNNLAKDANNIYDEAYVGEFSKEFDFTGVNNFKFVVPIDGNYKIELWGAQGYSNGAYTKGKIYLSKDTSLYIYVGEKGNDGCNPYTSCTGNVLNGGASGGYFTHVAWPWRSGGGGGATDVRLVSGSWNNSSSLISRIMVAGGGGGGVGGYGGTLTGGTGSSGTEGTGFGGGGGTQTAGGSSSRNAGAFGIGGIGYTTYPEAPNNNDSGGGGGGYYGGGGGVGGVPTSTGGGSVGSGGGGSSFISGYTGCNAVNESGAHTGQPNHYSGYIFSDMQMIAGNQTMPGPNGVAETGHSGHGYAKITYIP